MTAPEAATPTVTLLGAKLRIPRRRRSVVPRPRLTGRPVGRELPAVTLVSAPAGFGKTTLLTEWLSESPTTAWLSLDAADNDPARFWFYLIVAAQGVAAGVGEPSLSLLRASPSAVNDAVNLLLNDLDAVQGEVIVVLDDYHVIESGEIHEAMANLIDHLPPHVHVVLASRADPPLPLARLRARGELLEIRATELRFTAAEAETYFNEKMGLQLSADDVNALEARTEGWVAALQLLALSMQNRDDIGGFISSFTGDDRFVVDYLVEEVLERQRDDVRRFLMDTSILSRLTGSLCDAVTGGSTGKSTLEMLERANLFLVPLDDQRTWYRYHHLFADMLRARLLDEQPERVAELHRRASTWWNAHGDRQEAITHAMAGGDFDKAAELIELAIPVMRQRRLETTVRGWLEAMPDELLQTRPVLSVALAGARMTSGAATGIERLLASAESCLDAPAAAVVFDKDEFAQLPAQIAVFRAGLALLAGDVEGTIAHASRALELENHDPLRLGSATALLGLAYWTSGELEAARPYYTEAVGLLVQAGHISDVMGMSLGLADIQVAQGRLGEAIRTFESGLQLARDYPGLRGVADLHYGLSEVLLERNDLDAAATQLEASARSGEAAGLPQYPYRWRVVSARLHQARGDMAGALELLDEAERLYNTDFSPGTRPIPALKARLHLAAGDFEAARRWTVERSLTSDDNVDYLHEFEHITFARVLLAAGSSDATTDALGLLDRLFASAEEGRREGTAIEILVLQALAHNVLGDTPAATTALISALRRAEPEGYIRVFVDADPKLGQLMRTLTGTDPAAATHAKRILAATHPSSMPTPSRPRVIDELSGRELDVLRLLRSDLSGPDIARELLVSLNTLRTHTKNIYAKLGVNNRREAVRRATELGL